MIPPTISGSSVDALTIGGSPVGDGEWICASWIGPTWVYRELGSTEKRCYATVHNIRYALRECCLDPCLGAGLCEGKHDVLLDSLVADDSEEPEWASISSLSGCSLELSDRFMRWDDEPGWLLFSPPL